eukprot:14819669-Alexandrium_andersonii.AAC.1
MPIDYSKWGNLKYRLRGRGRAGSARQSRRCAGALGLCTRACGRNSTCGRACGRAEDTSRADEPGRA